MLLGVLQDRPVMVEGEVGWDALLLLLLREKQFDWTEYSLYWVYANSK